MTTTTDSTSLTLPSVINGDCLHELKNFPDNSIDAIITDPPYGLSNTDPSHTVEAVTQWVTGNREYTPVGKGFMGSLWDAFVPPPAVWDECIRVLKPGGHLLAFTGSRTVDLMTLSIRFAGFDIRDTITYVTATGFPKSYNLSKAIDKKAGKTRQSAGTSSGPNNQTYQGERYTKKRETMFGIVQDQPEQTLPATELAAQWEGWGTALKPATEPIVVARKPLEGNTLTNVLKYGTGAINIDATRIGTAEDIPSVNATRRTDYPQSYEGDGAGWGRSRGGMAGDKVEWQPTGGRWPANFVLTHSEDCEQTGITQIKAITGTNSGRGTGKNGDVYGTYAGRNDMEAGAPVGLGDENGMETVETWECVPGCPVAELDEQTRHLHSAGSKQKPGTERNPAGSMFGIGNQTGSQTRFGDKGGASRFFYTAKARKTERPEYTKPDGTKVTHPTVKPLRLMQWLVRLVTPPGGTILDPFAGSGATLEAAWLEGFDSVGIEREPDFAELIRIRLLKHEPENSPKNHSEQLLF